MSTLRVLCRDQPRRSIALATNDCVLEITQPHVDNTRSGPAKNQDANRYLLEAFFRSSEDLQGYRVLGEGWGTLGLISLNNDVFICVVTSSSRAATVRPGETVLKIENVDFYCLNRSDYEYGEDYQTQSRFAAEDIGSDELNDHKDVITDHPFLALKRLLSDGSFYYSRDFNLTDRIQDRSTTSSTFGIDGLNKDMLWNSYMIDPLLLFRSRLSKHEQEKLDGSRILTSVIRGFAGTLAIPASALQVSHWASNLPSSLTIISRLSSRRAGTRFNSRGIDDDGNVSNFVETDTILWSPPGITFSYTQARGSVPIFWEQTPGLIPGQQKIEISRSFEATQNAFEKHFDFLELNYGAVHIMNLLSDTKNGELALSSEFRKHVAKRSAAHQGESSTSFDHHLLRMTDFDFHAEARGPLGYEVSNLIYDLIKRALNGFGYSLIEGNNPEKSSLSDRNQRDVPRVILQQEGIFRTNCLDCLDRTNLVQTIISLMALELYLNQRGGNMVPEIRMRHSALWADNGDALSKVYAGTGALKSSFTRHGKMSLAGAFADARKSATRLYVNNFADKARQNTIDILLGRLNNQVPVELYDPVNDIVMAELERRAEEYTSSRNIRIWAGTFNVNGRGDGTTTDLSPWLLGLREKEGDNPTLVVVAFQEIVELSPQQIMSTDPLPRMTWENSVKDCLNEYADRFKTNRYVLLRSGQLVGAAILVYVREDALNDIKNVEGSVKKASKSYPRFFTMFTNNTIKTGLSGMAGNKGGCAIRLEFSNTRICFVTAHLAAGFANYDERNKDYATISSGMRFRYNRSIEDHDAIIWLGDFNYRIGLENQEVRQLIKLGELGKLYEHDQLNLQMLAGRTFPFYSEGIIKFAPTYKYDIGTDNYDTSDKSRIPAWCDRVLWKGAGLKQIDYRSANLKTSDHRPVLSLFDCAISIVDETQKEKLNRVLYDQHRSKLRTIASGNLLDDDNDDDVLLPSANSLGLPPPSSDRQKWWLDNGPGARSNIKPSTQGDMPNIIGRSNPFAQSNEPEWIKPQTLLEVASSNWSIAKPQRPQKPTTLIQQLTPAKTNMAQYSDVGAANNRDRELKPRLPPQPPTWGTDHLTPEAERIQPRHASADLLDGDDPVMEKWKPLLPHR
ncbi:hypothetical protein UA08_03935 [Talaromyces atroroseus]|uniref:phosphoinositide 5-phosphatase n=1 Tax=Talaromyces atroroseus TaxID=1441469 RepID=A0A225AU67_TALAT|nr:hypothetical protein UA08_03935 [Talaromyces atroroseus]OKL60838.1 hypothetical protein UA08_03935 [Talaromyces atroroseus]